MHHFDNVGLYDALFVMQDKETKTLWNHITGEALYGPLVGRTLGPASNLLQLSVEQALAIHPTVQVAISGSPYAVNGRLTGAGPGGGGGLAGGGVDNLSPTLRLSPNFSTTLGGEDTQRPQMELGLGIFTARTARYYPLGLIRQRGALIDRLDGRTVLVYMDPTTFTPTAMFVNATRADVENREIRLDTGSVVRLGVLYDARGARVEAERPPQMFTRWYGFSLTFPKPEIFGQ